MHRAVNLFELGKPPKIPNLLIKKLPISQTVHIVYKKKILNRVEFVFTYNFLRILFNARKTDSIITLIDAFEY